MANLSAPADPFQLRTILLQTDGDKLAHFYVYQLVGVFRQSQAQFYIIKYQQIVCLPPEFNKRMTHWWKDARHNIMFCHNHQIMLYFRRRDFHVPPSSAVFFFHLSSLLCFSSLNLPSSDWFNVHLAKENIYSLESLEKAAQSPGQRFLQLISANHGRVHICTCYRLHIRVDHITSTLHVYYVTSKWGGAGGGGVTGEQVGEPQCDYTG